MAQEVTVNSLPACDICTQVGAPQGLPAQPAAYDGKTIVGPWANMCPIHFEMMGVGLGPGRGQRLVLAGGK